MPGRHRPRTGRVEVVGEWTLGVHEASGIACLGHDTLLAVDDERGVIHTRLGASPTLLDAGRGISDLEGICVTPEGDHAYVLAESDGSVWRFDISGDALVDRQRLGALPRVGKKKNRGWEGLSYAPAGTFSRGAELIAAHQAKPRLLGFFAVDGLTPRLTRRLPKAARKALGDLNDVAVDGTGRILVLSGRSGRIAELRLVDDELELICVYRIDSDDDDVPEGLTIDARGHVWLCSDGRGTLRHLVLEP